MKIVLNDLIDCVVLVFKLCVELNVIFVSWLLFSGIVVVFLKLVFMKLKMNKI